MLYSESPRLRKGPLGNIWIAAYYFKKLKKQQIADTDITSTIDTIITEVRISYRVLAQLLLGVVRIFSRKVDCLYHDCNEALTNIRKSFIPTAQKKSNSGPQHTVQKKANREPQCNAAISSEVTHSSEQNASAQKKGSPAMQIEAFRTMYQYVTISLPECFELDAFDLDVADGEETAKPHEESILEDERTNEKDQHSFLNECRHMEVNIHAKYNFACFSPVDDVIPSDMMDLEITGFYNSSSIEVRGTTEESENHEGVKASTSVGTYLHVVQQEDQVHSVNLQDKMPLNIQREVQFDEPKNQLETVNLRDTTPNCIEESHELTEENSEAGNLNKAHDKSDTPGLPSPKFAVTTPARKETRRMCKKRKILFDETIVLSNGTVRTWIHDTSNLVRKRRKVPHTSLDAWRAYTITYLQQNLMEPVIPYLSSKHKAFLHKKLPDYSPQKKSTSSSFIDAVNLQNEISNKSIDPHGSLHVKTHSDTPPPANYSDISTPDRSEVRMKEPSPLEISASAFDMMDKELDSSEKESNEQESGWSVRTRVVAKYLYDGFLDLKEQKRKENLNLDRILVGQTRAKSARFFYETLTLKGHGCIDVEQDFPYADIIVSASPQLEDLFNNRSIAETLKAEILETSLV